MGSVGVWSARCPAGRRSSGLAPTSARAGRRLRRRGWSAHLVAVEVALIGYSNEPSLQAVYAVLGVAIVLIAARCVVVDGWHRLLGAASSG